MASPGEIRIDLTADGEVIKTYVSGGWVNVSGEWISTELKEAGPLDNPDKRDAMLDEITKAVQDLSPNSRQELLDRLEDELIKLESPSTSRDYALGFQMAFHMVERFFASH